MECLGREEAVSARVWNTSNLNWWDLQMRRARTIWLAMKVYRRTTRCEQETDALGEGPKATKMWAECNSINAREIVAHLEESKGLMVKAGQYMSTRADVVPEEYLSHLKRLTDSLPHSSFDEVKRVVKQDLGRPLDEVYREFAKVPIASASIAQVHHAKLRGSGETAVVKVQHEGVDRVIAHDLETLRIIVDKLADLDPRIDLRPIYAEWMDASKHELNFEDERQALIRGKKCMEDCGSTVEVPTPHPEFSGQHVLTMEFMEGFCIRDLADDTLCKKHGIDKRVVLEQLFDSYGYMVFVEGFFHADPHTGNILVRPDSQVVGGAAPVLIDWGLVRAIKLKDRIGLARVLHSISNFDITGLMQGLDQLGYKFKQGALTEEDKRHFLTESRHLWKDTMNREESFKYHSEHKKMVKKRFKEEAHREQVLEEWPRVVLFVIRVMTILQGLASSLNVANVSILSIFARRAREALLAGESVQKNPQTTKRREGIFSMCMRLHLDELCKSGQVAGAQVVVIQGEKVVCDVAVGTADTVSATPVTVDSQFSALGVANGVASIAVLRALHRRGVSLRTRVVEVWPNFSNGSSSVTVGELLSHCAGLQSAFPVPFSTKELNDDECMIRHLEKSKLPNGTRKAQHAYLLQSFALSGLAKKVLHRNLADVIQAELSKPLALHMHFTHVARDQSSSEHANSDEVRVCRDIPDLNRVRPGELSSALKGAGPVIAGASRTASSNNGSRRKEKDAGTQKIKMGHATQTLLQALRADIVAFDPLQANGTICCAGLGLRASAKDLARIFSSKAVLEDLRAMDALLPRHDDPTALGWLLSGGANRWSAGGLQLLQVRRKTSWWRSCCQQEQHGYGVVCGLGPCVAHFPDVAGGLTVAVMVNDVLHGRQVSASVMAEAFRRFGLVPTWSEMPIRVRIDAFNLVRHEAKGLLSGLGSLMSLNARQFSRQTQIGRVLIAIVVIVVVVLLILSYYVVWFPGDRVWRLLDLPFKASGVNTGTDL